MEPIAVILILSAAVMHAVWNAFVKMDGDRLMTMAVVISTTGLLAPMLLLIGPPPALESWPYILLSVLLNNAYFLFLIEAYRFGDLSQVYPIARGSAPLLVAVGAALFANEQLSVVELAGVFIISAGTISLIWRSGLRVDAEKRSIIFALLTGLMIASYTIIDGIGVRLSGNPAAYIGWLFILSPLPIASIAIIRRRGEALVYIRNNWKLAVLAGGLNLGSYGLSIWALSLAAMAHVSAMRETSVIIAALIGTQLLGESFGKRRILAAMVVATGVILIAQ
jgi:drug/metabolite transporter (DMT)-like permease